MSVSVGVGGVGGGEKINQEARKSDGKMFDKLYCLKFLSPKWIME